MTSKEQLDRQLRHLLEDVARAVDEPTDLADRLIAAATHEPAAPHRVDVARPARRRMRHWTPPLLVAAAVIAIAIGTTAAVSATASHHAPAVVPPTPTLGTSPSSAPTTPQSPSTTPSSPATSTKASGVTAPVNPVEPPAVHHTAPVPSDFIATDASFIDATNGWAVGYGTCSSGTVCTDVIRTTDGGATWSLVGPVAGTVPDNPANEGSCASNGDITGPCVSGLTFASENVGYAWGFRSLYLTTDGGTTWHKQPDGARQLIVGGGYAVRAFAYCSAGCQATIEAAPVGTDNWQNISPTFNVDASGFQLLSDGQRIYLNSRPVLDDPNANPTTTLASWTGSGRAWAAGSTLCSGGYADGMALTASSTFAVLCTHLGGNSAQTLAISTDGGLHFGPGRPVPASSRSVYLWSPTSGIIDSSAPPPASGQLAGTEDGGATWTPLPPAGFLSAGGPPDARWLLSTDGEFWTSNNGGPWTVRSFTG